MTDVTVPQTKLDAVNLVLWSIGETPVNTLEVSGIRDVANAVLLLDRTTREILAQGWDFNTDENWKLSPDASKNILIPSNALSVDPVDKTRRIVERSNEGVRMLWDKDRHSWEFDAPVLVNITWGMEFDELPETARNYIATRAARQYQAGALGSELVYRFTAQHETEARTAFRREHALVRDANLLRSNPIFHRRHNPRR